MEHLSSETIFIALLFIASLVAIIAKRLRLPYTIALVITGLLAGLFVSPLVPAFELTPHLIFQIFLPALLFEAAFHLDFGHLWDNIRLITLFGRHEDHKALRSFTPPAGLFKFARHGHRGFACHTKRKFVCMNQENAHVESPTKEQKASEVSSIQMPSTVHNIFRS